MVINSENLPSPLFEKERDGGISWCLPIAYERINMGMLRHFSIALAAVIFLFAASDCLAQPYDLPQLPAPELYGTLLMNRLSEKNKVKPVVFSHWVHRTKYTCRVCHGELEFGFKADTTEITEQANMQGRFCGACHNGKTAFGHTKENCARCHSGDMTQGKEKFKTLASMPKTGFGNRINWVEALGKRQISPKATLLGNKKTMTFEKPVELADEKKSVQPVTFLHKVHTQWLDCSNCHPDVFNFKKTGQHFPMEKMARAQYCGMCHLKVAFPLNDCGRCHAGMKS